MLGARVGDCICFSVIYYAGPSLPLNFRELQYAFLQDKYVGEVEQHYLDIRRLIEEFENPMVGLQAILDSPDDQTDPRASSLLKGVIHSTQNFFVGTPNSTQRFSSRGNQIRLSSNHYLSIRNGIADLAILDSTTSHSSPSSLASPPLVTTPAMRLRGHSRDLPAKVGGYRKHFSFFTCESFKCRIKRADTHNSVPTQR